MENKDIIRLLKNTAMLMELHEENPFKIRSFTNAIFNLEKSTSVLASLTIKELELLEGVGKSMAANIDEMNREGKLTALETLREKTPEGVIKMLDIKGIGPKKIREIWKQLEIETIEDLLKACEANKIATLKGFGKKTQENIVESLKYQEANSGKFHYAAALPLAKALKQEISAAFPKALVSFTGALRRKLEVIDKIEMLVGLENFLEVSTFLDRQAYVQKQEEISGPFIWRGYYDLSKLALEVRLSHPANYYENLLKHTGAQAHLSTRLENGDNLIKILCTNKINSEEEAYEIAGLPFMAPELREGLFEFELARENKIPENLIQMNDLKGIFHNHSTYSDGKHTLREMAVHCRELGYEYLGISDHSKSAFYANGLPEEKIIKQHEEIDALNRELAPFKVFKGIESDILTSGDLDYPEAVLKTFDFVVASIHSGFQSDINKNTERLITAIKNPYTTILGHPTGRLLLKREGYPIDHKAVIDACAENNVIIEINANPKRLDMDWRWVQYALSKNVMLTINPDAHDKKEYDNMAYGVAVGRKGGLTKERNLNSFSRDEVENVFLQKRSLSKA